MQRPGFFQFTPFLSKFSLHKSRRDSIIQVTYQSKNSINLERELPFIMSVVGLITEYNPFHNGHLYHIQEAKRISGASTVVVVMSGNFVQRGTVAMVDKYTRTSMALQAGADLVIELPVCYATASAEYFASGAISILDKLGFVDSIVFGSECGDITVLKTIAQLYEHEPKEVTTRIQSYLRDGMNYPAARALAMKEYLTHHNPFSSAIDLEQVLNSPNNILGIEYIKAIHRQQSKLIPMTIERVQAHFHSEELCGSINSATAIRKAVLSSKANSLDEVKTSMPEFALQLLEEHNQVTCPIDSDDLTLLLKCKLLSESVDSLSSYLDVSHDLAHRILRFKWSNESYEQMVATLKSKQYTQTRIQRALLHILLGITTDAMEEYKKRDYTPYARILGLRTSASHYLKAAIKNQRIEVITKVSNHNLTGTDLHMLELDLYATHLYQLLISHKFGTACKDEYTHGIVRI